MERTTGTVTIRLPHETHQLLLDLAALRGIQVEEVITRAARLLVDEEGAERRAAAEEAARRLEEDAFWAEANAASQRFWDEVRASGELDALRAKGILYPEESLELWPYEGIEELLARVEDADDTTIGSVPASQRDGQPRLDP